MTDEHAVTLALRDHPDSTDVGFLTGRAMTHLRGQGDPAHVAELIKRRLGLVSEIKTEADLLAAMLDLADTAERYDNRPMMAGPTLMGAAIAYARTSGLSEDQVLAMIGDSNAKWTPSLALKYSQARKGQKGSA